MNRTVDLLIIGGGSAGLAAAIGAYEGGVRDILILEREEQLGGILRQCIHNGFGLHTFKEELTGPEYAARYVERVRALGIEALTGTMVLSLSADKVATAINQEGLLTVRAKAVVLAMGCRERPRGALVTPGTRPAGRPAPLRKWSTSWAICPAGASLSSEAAISVSSWPAALRWRAPRLRPSLS